MERIARGQVKTELTRFTRFRGFTKFCEFTGFEGFATLKALDEGVGEKREDRGRFRDPGGCGC